MPLLRFTGTYQALVPTVAAEAGAALKADIRPARKEATANAIVVLSRWLNGERGADLTGRREGRTAAGQGRRQESQSPGEGCPGPCRGEDPPPDGRCGHGRVRQQGRSCCLDGAQARVEAADYGAAREDRPGIGSADAPVHGQ
ncbi:hypothetical protein GCM10010420_55190 [Streptomyces glaucosporus]|uniref:Uncharacterized protein n=1 Tax=Streptomyces glaucosporus TaxID=284044 RepID=A0ABP5W229_9ACTN